MTCPQEGENRALKRENDHHKVVDGGLAARLVAVESRRGSWLHNGVTSSTEEHIMIPARGAGITHFGRGDCVGTLGGVKAHSVTKE